MKKVEDGIVYDTETAEIIYIGDGGRKILAITPDGHYFVVYVSGMISEWAYLSPYSRFMAVWWALRTKAPDDVLERLGVKLLPEPNVPKDKPYEPYHSLDVLCAKDQKFIKNNFFIASAQFLFKNPDGRFFLYDGMILLSKFVFEENKPMSQREALLWAIDNMAPWDTLAILGYERTEEEKARLYGGVK